MEILGLVLLAAGVATLAFAATRPRSPPRRTDGDALVAAPRVPPLAVEDVFDAATATRLRTAGVRTTRDLVEADPPANLDVETFARARQLAHFMAIPNVGREEAALLVAAGYAEPDELLAAPVADVAARLNAANASLALVPGWITPGEVRQWAESVRVGGGAGPRRLSQPSIARSREQAPGVA